MKCAISIIPCQFLTKGQDKANVEASKVKEDEESKVKGETLEVEGGKCWKKIWMEILSVTGELRYYCLAVLEYHRSHCILLNVM